MSNLAVGLVWQRSRAKGSNLLVLLAIADLADDNGRDFWQSNERLREKSRLSRRSLHYILNKLRKDDEIVIEPNVERRPPKKSRGYIPERYIHVRCIFDWEIYDGEGGAKIAQGAKKQRAQSLQLVERDSAPPGDEKLHASKRKDLLVDLSADLKAAPLARRESPEPEKSTYWQLVKLTHVVLDDAAFDSYAELSAEVKTRAVRLGMTYDAAVLDRAISSVTVQRGYDRRKERRAQ